MKSIDSKFKIKKVATPVIALAAFTALAYSGGSCTVDDLINPKEKNQDSTTCKTYEIPKGSNYAIKNAEEFFERFNGHKTQYSVNFKQGYLYNFYNDSIPENDEDQYDWNKLPGFTESNSPAFTGSQIQLVSRAQIDSSKKLTGLIEVAPYSVINGEIQFPKKDQIIAINPKETLDVEIWIDSSNLTKYNLKISSNSLIETNLTAPRARISEKVKDGYKLYPYFGGNQKAPNDIKIEICGWIDS